MAHFTKVTDRGVRRLAKRLEPDNIEGLLTVMTADAHGRPPRPRGVPEAVRNIARKAEELAVRMRAPEPIILGRHLLKFGFPPGKELGATLKKLYEAQLGGKFHDQTSGLTWLARQSRLAIPPAVRSAITETLAD